MSDYTKRWIELRRREQHADGTWDCHYVIFEFGSRAWRCKKGCSDGIFKTPDEAESLHSHRRNRSLIPSRLRPFKD